MASDRSYNSLIFATTGGGILVALEILYSMSKGKKASELLNSFKQIPKNL